MPVEIQIDVTKLHNELGDESIDEPYVLVGYFKIDGSSVAFRADLAHSSQPIDATGIAFSWTKLGRGNVMPEEVDEGESAQIEPAAGRIKLTLSPIHVDPPGRPRLYIPGLVLVVVSVIEEDLNTNDFVKAIQQRIKGALDTRVRDFLQSKKLSYFVNPVDDDYRIEPGHPGYLNALAARLRMDFQTQVREPLKEEIRSIVTDEAWGQGWAADHDDPIGSEVWVVPSNDVQLDALTKTMTLPSLLVKRLGTVESPEGMLYKDVDARYRVDGELAYRVKTSGRLGPVTTIQRKMEEIEGPWERILEIDAGECGRIGDAIQVKRMGFSEIFQVEVPLQRDEIDFVFKIGDQRIHPPDGLQNVAGTYVTTQDASWDVPGPGKGVWELQRFVVKDDTLECDWQVTSTSKHAYTVTFSRPAGPSARAALSVPLTVEWHLGGKLVRVERSSVEFSESVIDNPVLTCLLDQAAQGGTLVAPSLPQPGDPVPRPPWMDPPEMGLVPEGHRHGGWLAQMARIPDREDLVISSLRVEGAGATPAVRGVMVDALQSAGLAAEAARSLVERASGAP